jgi:hypothetical protein
MKIIGGIQPEYNESGEVVNGFYIGGAIAMLSEREARVLGLLQLAWDGDIFRFPPGRYEADDRDMNNAFKAIRAFVDAKFAINEFKDAINLLDDLLIKEDEEGK